MSLRSFGSNRSISLQSRIITPDTYIRNLPYSLCKAVADELDLPGTATNWKDFVVKIPRSPQNPEPKYTAQEVQRFEAVSLQGGSPTMAVIDSWMTTNATVQHMMDVLTSLGLQSLVCMIQSKLTLPPPYDVATGRSMPMPSQSRLSSSVPVVQATPDEPTSLRRPPYQRQPTEHESLPARSDHVNHLTGDSIPISALSLNEFGLGENTVSSYSYSSLRSVTSDFNNSFKLGEGAFGSVFKGQLTHTIDGNLKEPRKIAIKRLKLDTPEFASSIAEQFKKEVHVISELRHENILPLMGYSCDGPELCLVYDYMFNGSLSSSLEQCRKGTLVLNVGQRLEISRGSASGISYLHRKELIHRDIKSSNILLDSDMKPRISDFGLIRSTKTEISNKTSTRTTNPIGTPVYMSHESYSGMVSYAMDVFSFGVVLLELLTGLAVVDENRDPSHLTLYVEEQCEDEPVETFYDKSAGRWSPGIAESLFELSDKCRQYKRTKRPSMEKVYLELVALCEKEAASH